MLAALADADRFGKAVNAAAPPPKIREGSLWGLGLRGLGFSSLWSFGFRVCIGFRVQGFYRLCRASFVPGASVKESVKAPCQVPTERSYICMCCIRVLEGFLRNIDQCMYGWGV